MLPYASPHKSRMVLVIDRSCSVMESFRFLGYEDSSSTDWRRCNSKARRADKFVDDEVWVLRIDGLAIISFIMTMPRFMQLPHKAVPRA